MAAAERAKEEREAAERKLLRADTEPLAEKSAPAVLQRSHTKENLAAAAEQAAAEQVFQAAEVRAQRAAARKEEAQERGAYCNGSAEGIDLKSR